MSKINGSKEKSILQNNDKQVDFTPYFAKQIAPGMPKPNKNVTNFPLHINI